MDFFKKSCKELCEKLLNEEIANTNQLNDFVKTKCNFYNNNKDDDKENNAVIDKEKTMLSPIYDALKSKENKLGENYNYIKFKMTAESKIIDPDDVPLMAEYIRYLEKIIDALKKIGQAHKREVL